MITEMTWKVEFAVSEEAEETLVPVLLDARIVHLSLLIYRNENGVAEEKKCTAFRAS
jgi:hypothetical protein